MIMLLDNSQRVRCNVGHATQHEGTIAADLGFAYAVAWDKNAMPAHAHDAVYVNYDEIRPLWYMNDALRGSLHRAIDREDWKADETNTAHRLVDEVPNGQIDVAGYEPHDELSTHVMHLVYHLGMLNFTRYPDGGF